MPIYFVELARVYVSASVLCPRVWIREYCMYVYAFEALLRGAKSLAGRCCEFVSRLSGFSWLTENVDLVDIYIYV